MENEDKVTVIRPWIDSEERITVDFEDEKEFNAVVTEYTATLVTLALETSFPQLRQEITLPFRMAGLPLRLVHGGYSRDSRRLEEGRLRHVRFTRDRRSLGEC